MVQLKSTQLHSLYCCPYCLNSSLEFTDEGKLKCTQVNCSGNDQIPQVSEQPILVNFENSVFDIDNFSKLDNGSVISRQRSRLHKFLYRIIWGTDKKAKENSQIFIDKLLEQNPNPTILIVGGGTKGLGSDSLYSNPAVNIVSCDIYCSENTDFIADAHSIPLKDESVDGVWIQYVLEHVIEPTKVVSEIHRILKPNGLVYAATPFMQQVHEKAYDFTRFTENGHRWLFKNFELIKSGVIWGPGTVLLWTIRSFFAALFRSKKIGTLSLLFFFWVRFFDKIMPENYSSDGASAFFFMGRKNDKAMNIEDIIKFYRGVH